MSDGHTTEASNPPRAPLPVALVIADEADRLPEEPQFSLLMLSSHSRKWREQYLIACNYRDAPDHRCWVARVGERAVAACGSVESADRVTIHYLGVQTAFRRRGIGGALVRFVVEAAERRVVVAETDASGAAYYAALGFAIESLGVRYPNVERFLCRSEPA